MNNPSHRHHYIPEFYLKNFTNQEGKFYIYLVKEKRFKRNGELFTTKSHFFTEHGNTINFQPHLPDYLETKHYTPLDSDISPLIEKIKNSTDLQNELTQLEMIQVNYFVSHLYWRSPLRDSEAKKLMEERSLTELGFIFKGNEMETKLAERLFRSNPDFFKMVKWMLPLGLHYINLELEMEIAIRSFSDIAGTSLLSDNPIVFREKENINSYSEEMIIPLTSKTFYIRNKAKNAYLDLPLKTIIDLIQFHQANEYVCVTDMAYIEKLKLIDNYFNLSLDGLKEYLFRQIKNSPN